MTEYRLVWKRVGKQSRSLVFHTVKGLQTKAAALRWSDEQPQSDWEADAHVYAPNEFAGMPKLEWIRIEEREVGPWLSALLAEKAP